MLVTGLPLPYLSKGGWNGCSSPPLLRRRLLPILRGEGGKMSINDPFLPLPRLSFAL